MQLNALIIFARKPVLGKVKTRLAAQIGDEAALHIYERLLVHTREVALQAGCDVHVFLTESNANDFWKDFHLHLQSDGELGVKMHKAFKALFSEGYDNVLIIGSDCPGLQAEHIQHAFAQLPEHDIVIGPAADGGYYLLGMTRLQEQLFYNKNWSTDSVYRQTIADIEAAAMSYFALPQLHDVDTLDDLKIAGWL